MSEQRATKSGLAAEAHAKVNAKYDEDLARQALTWVNSRITATGHEPITTDGSRENFHKTLEDGTVLCCLISAIDPAHPVKIAKKPTMAFKKMECIGQFLNAIDRYGVTKAETFQTVDLYEKQNLAQVVTTLHALGRKVNTKDGHGGIGPKEAERHSREWTEEQLKAGQGVIGLQMGTNKGASQAGQSFGKQRMIVD
ncbi:myophilin-like [Mercenaria mercenaria]|uniref:myophilin-like n=1 Tax=Mercenaria mercenaria TaxID=6596 RepID=UPI001E1D6E84|nr:myophilin-like [Mercenaria mercenaria]